MFASAQYTDASRTLIAATGADGTVRFIPVDELNADYRALVDAGVTISPPA